MSRQSNVGDSAVVTIGFVCLYDLATEARSFAQVNAAPADLYLPSG